MERKKINNPLTYSLKTKTKQRKTFKTFGRQGGELGSTNMQQCCGETNQLYPLGNLDLNDDLD